VTVLAYAADPRLKDGRHTQAAAAIDLADWLRWLEAGNIAPRTLDTYERQAAVLLRDWPDIALAEFNDGHLLHTLMKFPPKSRHLVKAAWNNWFRWGFKYSRRIQSNPVDLLPNIKYKPPRTYDLFSEVEADALCALPTPTGELMTVLFWTGLRRSEARMLTAKRVDWANRLLLVIEGAKGGKHRAVPLVQRAVVALDQLVTLEGIGPDDYLWGTKPGGGRRRREWAMSNTAFDGWWKKALVAAGVRHRVPHTTRHTFATRLRELGLELDEIQLILGHESIRTTSDTYIMSNLSKTGDRMREVVDA
jgi:integrase/recombinase XerD